MFFDPIKHSHIMKGMKLNLAAIAVLLGTGAAFATSAKPVNVKWGLQGSTYVQVTGAYTCETSTNICTRTYPAGQNPNTNPNGYISQELGAFGQ
jgi:hypothetical protein